LKREGWVQVHITGSHHKFKHPGKPNHVTVPHPKKKLPIGILGNIYQQAGWPWSQEIITMLYPLYVHHEKDSNYGGTFPDIPGCFIAADELADLPRKAQEAVEAHFDGEDVDVPAASDIDRWKDNPDYQGGYWLLVDIDLARVNAKPVRLNVSLPANLVQHIDRYAEANHMTRSGFLARAAQEALGHA
jgi:predicted RNA binding protein YcfA (HicA-like mRNA interferase family)/predicted RNase H-like HicB family nuclease